MIWPAAVQARLDARLPIRAVWLLWCRPKPFAGGSRVGVGLSTDDDHATLTVEGEARLYWGAQGGMGVPVLTRKVGTTVGAREVGLSLTPEGEALLRGYDTRLAPVELHCAVYDPGSGDLVGIGREFRGTVDGTGIQTPEQGGQASASVSMVSRARRGTMTVVGVKSDAAQRRRDPTDGFHAYASLGSVASDPWGGEA